MARTTPRPWKVVTDRPAVASAGIVTAVWIAAVAGVVMWLRHIALGSPQELIDTFTWFKAGIAMSLAWRLAFISTMAIGGLWARNQVSGASIDTATMLKRLAERRRVIFSVAVYWTVLTRLLRSVARRFGDRSRIARWAYRWIRYDTATSTVAAIASIIRRTPPVRGRDARASGRAAVGGRTAAAATLVVGVATVSGPVFGTLAGATQLGGIWGVVAAVAVLPVAFAAAGMVIGAGIVFKAHRRGLKRAGGDNPPSKSPTAGRRIQTGSG